MRNYAFPDLPLDGTEPGTSLLVAGAPHEGAESLALRLMDIDDDEGALFVSTDRAAKQVLRNCEQFGVDLDADRVGLVDCVGSDTDAPVRVLTVSGPEDLTGIGMRYTKLYADLRKSGVERVRTGIVSATTLLSFAETRDAARLVHSLAGRVSSVDGFGAFLVDPSTLDDREVNTIARFCDGRVEVRRTDEGNELRVSGLAGRDGDWRSFET